MQASNANLKTRNICNVAAHGAACQHHVHIHFSGAMRFFCSCLADTGCETEFARSSMSCDTTIHCSARSGSEATIHRSPRSGSDATIHQSARSRSGFEATIHQSPRSGSDATIHQSARSRSGFEATIHQSAIHSSDSSGNQDLVFGVCF